MHIIKRGTTRIVIAFPTLGFVIKIPRMGFKKITGTIKCLIIYFKYRRNSKIGIIEYLEFATYLISIFQNIRERQIYKQTKSPFLWPTWFSFFGLFNIQPFARNVLVNFSKKERVCWFLQLQTITKMYCWEDIHSWEPNNFCLDKNGKARMIDYGSWCMPFIIKNFGDNLFEKTTTELDFSDQEINDIESLSDSLEKQWRLNRLKYSSSG